MYLRSGVWTVWAFLWLPSAAWAGMPSLHLSDVARMRLETISFFLAGFFLSAWLIKWLWNYLGRDWTMLPRLSYGKALVLTALWGLLFILVLTMISGARELMTPGAWKKEGLTYRLADPPGKEAASTHYAQSEAELELERRRQLERLRDALWDFARSNGGEFPAATRIPDDLWILPRTAAFRYVYRGGKATQPEGTPLAYEPEIYGPRRYVLFTNGHIRGLTSAELQSALGENKR